MGSLHMVSPTAFNSFKVGGRKIQKRAPPDVTYSVKPFNARSFTGSNVRHQFHNRAAVNKASKLSKFSVNSSCQSFITFNDSSTFIPKRSNASNSSNVLVDSSNEDKAVKRNSRKKARKKGKQKRKHLCDASSNIPEVCCDYALGSSPSEIYGDNDTSHRDGVMSSAISLEVSSPESIFDITDFQDKKNGIYSYEYHSVFTSNSDEVVISEAVVPCRLDTFLVERPLINSEIGMERQDQTSPMFHESVEKAHPLQAGFHVDSGVQNSVSSVSNTDESTFVGHNVRLFDDNSHEIGKSDLKIFNIKKGHSSQRKLLGSVVDTYDYADHIKNGGQGLSSVDVQVVTPCKKGKKYKTVPRNSSSHKHGNSGNSHGCTGKENNHSIWQKVQRNGVDERNAKLKKTSPVCSQLDLQFKRASLLKRNCNTAEGTSLSRSDDKEQLKDKTPRKLKRKVSPFLKQKNICLPRKGPHLNKVNSVASSSMPINSLTVPTSLNCQKRVNNISKSCSQIGCMGVEVMAYKDECMNFETVNQSKVCSDNLELAGRVCNIVSGTNSQSVGNRGSSQIKSCVSLDPQNVLQVPSPVYFSHLLFNDVVPMEKEISLAENSKQNPSSGSILQKWVPIRVKELSNRLDTEDCTSRNTADHEVALTSKELVSSLNARMMCVEKGSSNVCSSYEDEDHGNPGACSIKYNNDKQVGFSFLTSSSCDKTFLAHETDLNEIARAVNDACRAQMASEAVQMATGGPIAEFERLLHFCSPVVSHSLYSASCQNCLQDQVSNALLCRHETPNVLLGCLWQWYEKHGSYGLEIRVEDFKNTKRLGVDRFAFRAYFVPFLSAVQLFRNCESHSMNNDNLVSSPWVSESCETSSMLGNSSNVKELPIFSEHFPKPHTSDTSALPFFHRLDNVDKSEQSSVSTNDELSVEAVDMTCSNKLELLFEYFESEQPQQRRPLYDKIQELVSGIVPSQSKMHGDPVNLNSMYLHDLHPRSWYSVAWYPIYRIPDGNLRAAFLTYHSLGHLVRRSVKYDYTSSNSCIVSPVVGLRSYNAQGECWFQPRNSKLNQTLESQGLNPSEILKERLRTLEDTASVMARAIVSKGNQTTVNRHPDYEFFLSRRC
ncbi:hypothetical protein SLA2020_493510 [Shorea laevis]